jgi:hypothetical protein
MTIFVPLSSLLLYRGDKVTGNKRADTFYDKKPGLPMPHWSDKHTRVDECQPLVRKKTAFPPDQYAVANVTRVSKYTAN